MEVRAQILSPNILSEIFVIFFVPLRRFWDRGIKSPGIKKNMKMWDETVCLAPTVTTLYIKVAVFRNVTPSCCVDEYQSFGGTCCLPADGGSLFLRNICTHLPKYTASHHRLPYVCFTVRIPYLMLSVKKTNSVAVVRKRTIPTERPPLGEVSAKLCE
jgi:hypothetical protein